MDEQVYYESEHARITSAAARIAGTTYPISGITSVRMKVTPPSQGSVVLGIGAGLAGMFALIEMLGTDGPHARGVLLFVLCFGLIGLAFLFASQAHESFQVLIGTAGAERAGMATVDRKLAEDVTAALEHAITDRSR